MPRTWDREHRWQKRLSIEQLAGALDHARTLTEVGTVWHLAKHLDPPSEIDVDNDTEAFLAELAGAADTEIDQVLLTVHMKRERLRPAPLSIRITRFGDTTGLSVRGLDRTQVEGVFAQMKEHLDRRVDGRIVGRTGVPVAAPNAEPKAPGPIANDDSAPAKKYKRWVQNHWVISVVGGLFATLLGALILGWVT